LGRLFGTDGVRGTANKELTPEMAFQLGRAGTASLVKDKTRPQIVIGRDTRISCDMLEAGLIAGICSVGGDALLAGIVPTPAVAYLTKDMEADAGIVISASHNPVEDNGIKFFHKDGFKLPDAMEDDIEKTVRSDLEKIKRPIGPNVGRVVPIGDAAGKYIQYVLSKAELDLDGLKIVVDCANGAASFIAPKVYEQLGAEVIPINNSPDGININLQCGSTFPEVLKHKVLEIGADMGLTHDGDADRVLACDHMGNVIDGDQIMAICGLDLLRKKELPKKTIVATVMSNLGLDIAFRKEGGKVVRTKVGDRYVLEEMRKEGLLMGGEQSGHIIFLNQNTTGDGIVTAIQLLKVVSESKTKLRDLASQVEKLPQTLVNIKVENKEALEENQKIKEAVNDITESLGEQGRILVRPSGTEPKVRIMVECGDADKMDKIIDEMSSLIRSELC